MMGPYANYILILTNVCDAWFFKGIFHEEKGTLTVSVYFDSLLTKCQVGGSKNDCGLSGIGE